MGAASSRPETQSTSQTATDKSYEKQRVAADSLPARMGALSLDGALQLQHFDEQQHLEHQRLLRRASLAVHVVRPRPFAFSFFVA